MSRVLTLALTVAGFALASCETVKSKKDASCCDAGSSAACCAEQGKGGTQKK